MKKFKCKICRRLGQTVCSRAKCAFSKRPTPPGQQVNARRGKISEYGMQLKEKQKLKYSYGLREKQFRNYIKDALGQRGKVTDAADYLIQKIESRLDNVVFKLGIASSRAWARQLVSHGHILVNEKRVNIPSFSVKKGDKISVKPGSIKKNVFQNLLSSLKKYDGPSWLDLSVKKLEGKVLDVPSLEEASLNVEITSIFEHYSR
jgi:small subunit ribosomal protein S4